MDISPWNKNWETKGWLSSTYRRSAEWTVVFTVQLLIVREKALENMYAPSMDLMETRECADFGKIYDNRDRNKS